MFTWDATQRIWWVSLSVNGETLDVRLDPQVAHPEHLEPIRPLFERVIALEAQARQAAADALLQGYNEGWADDDEGPGVLDHDGFMALMRLGTVTVEADGSATYWFDDGEMFAGHVIMVDLDATGTCTNATIAG